VLIGAVTLVLLVKWTLLFGWISRRFERQADVYSVRVLALTGLPCARPCALHHELPGAPESGGDRLCASAAQLVGDMLHEVGALNGIATDAGSWRHGSLLSRSQALMRLAYDPLATQRFEESIRRTQVAVLIFAGLAAAWATFEMLGA
jgi:hypothetical protein